MYHQTVDLATRKKATEQLQGVLKLFQQTSPQDELSLHPEFEKIHQEATAVVRKAERSAWIASPVGTLVFLGLLCALVLLNQGTITLESWKEIGAVMMFFGIIPLIMVPFNVYEWIIESQSKKLTRKYGVDIHINRLPQKMQKPKLDEVYCTSLIEKAVTHPPMQKKLIQLIGFLKTVEKDSIRSEYAKTFEQVLVQASMYELLSDKEKKELDATLLKIEKMAMGSKLRLQS